MDWKQILSLNPRELTNDDKEQLLNTIAWFDSETEAEEMDLSKTIALLQISQEIMKYKSEQVEALTAELDEVTTRQGEEEMKRRDSEYDVKSLRSHKSSLADTDDYQIKYKNTKAKLKRQVVTNDSLNREIEKLKQLISRMEYEKNHLQNELQTLQQGESHSDTSEDVKEQRKELMSTVYQKNEQISRLLTEIDGVENENIALKEKLAEVRDELRDATNLLNKLTSELTASKLNLEEKEEIITSLTQETQGLRNEIQELDEEKKLHEKQIEEFAQEIDSRIDDWKKILEEKNGEIKELKRQGAQGHQQPRSSSSVNGEGQASQIAILNKILNERDDKIFELKTLLQNATKEMDECTEMLSSLTTQRNSDTEKISNLEHLVKELKAQLNAAHDRSQHLQGEVKFVERLSEKKDKDLTEILNRLKENGEIDLADTLQKVQNLKTQKRFKDKQISDLVKTCNKLQVSFEASERENLELRARLGLSEEELVSTTGVLSQQRKLKTEIQESASKIHKLEEEKLSLRFEIKKLNKTVSNLSGQLVDLGQKPKFAENENSREEDNLLKQQEVAERKATVSETRYTSIVEENEALRKGLHEILQSIQAKTESSKKEIKSETLEQLLRALDAKHISGWYHPAMRLQAELHALQGGNAELREQLRLARLELSNFKRERQELPQNKSEPTGEPNLEKPRIHSSSTSEIITNLNKHLLRVLEEYNKQEQLNNSLTDKINKYKTDFELISGQVSVLYNQYTEEKANWENEKDKFAKTIGEVGEKVEILESKLHEISKYTNVNTTDEAKLKQISDLSANVVTLNRKSVFLENENTKLMADLKNVRGDLLNAEGAVTTKIHKLCDESNSLKMINDINESKLKNTVNLDAHLKLQNNFDCLTLKHRELLNNFTEICRQNDNEITTLKENIDTLNNDKKEILSKLHDAFVKLNTFEVATFEIDKAKEVLSKKLAQVEINEITERQRANHTNNLYELVKEQLRKSEERFKEFERYNKEIMHKNLSLQENIKELQDKIMNNIDVTELNNLQAKHVELLESTLKLKAENDLLKRDLGAISEKSKTQRAWNSCQEYEFLSLKHQILDLQAVTDDKAVIARLSSDVVHARLMESETQNKLDRVLLQLKNMENEYDELKNSEQEVKLKNQELIAKLNLKISKLEDLIRQQREQYLGFIPLTCQRKFIESVTQIYKDKHATFLSLQNAQTEEVECTVLKEQLREQLKVVDEIKFLNKSEDFAEKFAKWYNEKCIVQLQELKYRRKAEFMESQLQQALKRVNLQDQQMSKLEEELLLAYQKTDLTLLDAISTVKLQPCENVITENIDCKVKLYKSEETQTLFDTVESPHSVSNNANESLNHLQIEVINSQKEVAAKEEMIEQLKSRIVELEMNISLFRKQLGDKQSQISFYEKHILELKSQKQVDSVESPEELNNNSKQEISALKTTVSSLQETLAQKEESILNYQSLLKQDRDEHSLAAVRFQEELKRLQSVLMTQQQAYEALKETQKTEVLGKAAIEQYIKQVHALDKHTSELHTTISSLDSQLQASRQECVRWRSLANDRLDGMDELRKELEETHKNELEIYKSDCEKWRQEVVNLKLFLSKRKDNAGERISDLEKILKEKEEKIHEISLALRQTKNEIKKKLETADSSPKIMELEAVKEQLIRDNETLKKRFEQIMNREKNAREEIRVLKGQLLKRPVMSARSDKNDTIKENLQKKAAGLEKEVEELKENLQKQLAINEAHKSKISEDFEKWNKQKYWQQTAEKTKVKLKEKSDEFDKLQQTCAGYRILIERLEREKHTLESRVKSLKGNVGHVNLAKFEILGIENAKLQSELEALSSKLEMQQHHSGGLGAAMLQEKLAGQERKIAILELAAKGTGEVRAELERLQSSNAALQKTNLRLEAENLELKLDIEKSSKELPHLREQVQHLENYVEVLKAENSGNHHQVTNSGDHQPHNSDSNPSRKVYELERTIFVLKRLVEKLQVENKRLNGAGRSCIKSAVPNDKLRTDFYRLREQYGDCIQKIARLEEELNVANGKLKTKPETEDLCEVKAQLSQKTELLERVKILLHRAADKEKSLLEEVARLRALIPSNDSSPKSP